MILTVKNLGMVESASVDIDAITVIAGVNNSGKSTIGKALYCVFNSCYEIDDRIATERLSLINNAIDVSYQSVGAIRRRVSINELPESIIANSSEFVKNEVSLRQHIKDFFINNDSFLEKHIESMDIDSVAKRVLGIISTSDDEILINLMKKKMLAEFNMQINNIHCPKSPTEIILKIKDADVIVSVDNNENVNISNSISLKTEAIYIDDPFALDNSVRYATPYVQRNLAYLTHREHLQMCLSNKRNAFPIKEAIDEIIVSKKLTEVYKKLNAVCSGEMVKRNVRSIAYREGSTDNAIDIANVSTGLKTFVIIKTLLLNGYLEENGIIILDEPEIH
jgi:energy-coupling factor transporter ATP-binding protein EcfA2